MNYSEWMNTYTGLINHKNLQNNQRKLISPKMGLISKTNTLSCYEIEIRNQGAI